MSERAVKLLQGYIWYPREQELDLGDHLPQKLEPNIHVLWDEMPAAPFTFFDDGTLSATQRFFQFTVLTLIGDEEGEDPQRLVPWLAEVLQERLEGTPEGVGWQVFEDLRDV